MKNQAGNALITLLIFVAVGITVTSGAVVVSVINTQGLSSVAQSERALHAAEAGAENAILRVLRDRTYTGETLTIGDSTVTITVSGTTTKTITSEGNYNDLRRTVQVDGTFTNGQLNITDWKEID